MKQSVRFALIFIGSLLLLLMSTAVTGYADEAATPAVGAPRLLHSTPVTLGSDVLQPADVGSRLIKGLLYTLAIFFIGIALYKRYVQGASSAEEGIEILARKHLGPKTALLVVRLEGKKFFLSVSASDVKLLSALDQGDAFEQALSGFLTPAEEEVANR